MALIETLIDDFNDNSINSSLWTNYTSSTTVAETNGHFVITPPTSTGGINYGGIISDVGYDLTGSEFFIEVIQATTNSAETLVNLEIDGNNMYQITKTGSNLRFRSRASGVSSDTSITYSSTDHRWWRIREASGTTYFDTSPDGRTWTNRRSLSNSITITSLKVNIAGGTYQSEASPSTAIFDNVNFRAETYIFDGSDSLYGDWSNEANSTDGDTSTYATETSDGGILYIEGTNAPASGGDIVEVKARVFAYKTGNTEINAYIQTTAFEFLGTIDVSATSGAWSDYITLITPTGGWTWALLQSLYFNAELTAMGAGPYLSAVSKVELEVAIGDVTLEPNDLTLSLSEDTTSFNNILASEMRFDLLKDVTSFNIIEPDDLSIDVESDEDSLNSLDIQDLSLGLSETATEVYAVLSADDLSFDLSTGDTSATGKKNTYEKRYRYKVYDKSGNYTKDITNTITSDLEYSEDINSIGSEATLTLGRNLEDTGEELDIKFGHVVKVYLDDKESDDELIFQGQIVNIIPVYDETMEVLQVTLFTQGYDLDYLVFRGDESVEQSQDSGSSEIIIGPDSTIAQSFIPDQTTITSIEIKVKAEIETTTLDISIQTNNSSQPSGTAVAGSEVEYNISNQSASVVKIFFDEPITVSTATTYWLVIGAS